MSAASGRAVCSADKSGGAEAVRLPDRETMDGKQNVRPEDMGRRSQSALNVRHLRIPMDRNGKILLTATADNLINPETGEQESRKDMAEVWTNSPQLEIDKTADKYEWQAGEQIAYRIVVNNVTAGTIAKDVNYYRYRSAAGTGSGRWCTEHGSTGRSATGKLSCTG